MANKMKSGMFVMPIHDPDKSLVQCLDEDIALALKCEELGFDDFWVGEHHSSVVENIVSPEIFLGKVIGMTERIRVGPAPVCCVSQSHTCRQSPRFPGPFISWSPECLLWPRSCTYRPGSI